MSDIHIRAAEGTWTVRAGGAVLGESRNAMVLGEGDLSEVIYFPRGDIAMAFLDPSDTTSHCPKKGDATYFSIVTKSRTIKDAAWSYEAPLPGAERIEGYIAFYATEFVAIEQI